MTRAEALVIAGHLRFCYLRDPASYWQAHLSHAESYLAPGGAHANIGLIEHHILRMYVIQVLQETA